MAQKSANQTELELIKKLYELNGYFTAAFTKEDIETMERNIAADYDLLCGTSRDESCKISGYEQAIKDDNELINRLQKNGCDLKAERDEALEHLRLLRKDVDDLQEDLYEKAHEVERLKYQVIRRDLQLGKQLTEEQKEMLVLALTNYED